MVRASYSWFSNPRRCPLWIFHAAAFVAFRLAATPICRLARMRVEPDGGFRPDAFDRADGASFLGARVQSPWTAVYPTGFRLHARAAWIMRPASV